MKFIINHTYTDMKVLSLFYAWLKNVCVSKWSSIYDGSFSFFLWVCVARVLDKSSTKRFYLKFLYILNKSWYIYAIIIANEPPHISIPSIRQLGSKRTLSVLFIRHIYLVASISRSGCLDICYMRQDAIIYPRTFTEETWQFSKWISTWHWSTPCTHSLCKQSLTLGLDKEYVQPLWLCRRKSRSSLIID